MPILKIRPPYKHLTQKKNFCGPACVQMILFRRGIWIEQELLAYKLDTKIDKKREKFYILPFRKARKSLPGLNIKKIKSPKVKELFRKFKLKSEVYYISKINSVEDFIVENLKKNNDIIACFWMKSFYGKDLGHYVLVSEYDRKEGMLIVCDPFPESKSFWKVELNKIVKAMGPEFDGNERGFIVVKSIK